MTDIDLLQGDLITESHDTVGIRQIEKWPEKREAIIETNERFKSLEIDEEVLPDFENTLRDGEDSKNHNASVTTNIVSLTSSRNDSPSEDAIDEGDAHIPWNSEQAIRDQALDVQQEEFQMSRSPLLGRKSSAWTDEGDFLEARRERTQSSSSSIDDDNLCDSARSSYSSNDCSKTSNDKPRIFPFKSHKTNLEDAAEQMNHQEHIDTNTSSVIESLSWANGDESNMQKILNTRIDPEEFPSKEIHEFPRSKLFIDHDYHRSLTPAGTFQSQNQNPYDQDHWSIKSKPIVLDRRSASVDTGRTLPSFEENGSSSRFQSSAMDSPGDSEGDNSLVTDREKTSADQIERRSPTPLTNSGKGRISSSMYPLEEKDDLNIPNSRSITDNGAKLLIHQQLLLPAGTSDQPSGRNSGEYSDDIPALPARHVPTASRTQPLPKMVQTRRHSLKSFTRFFSGIGKPKESKEPQDMTEKPARSSSIKSLRSQPRRVTFSESVPEFDGKKEKKRKPKFSQRSYSTTSIDYNSRQNSSGNDDTGARQQEPTITNAAQSREYFKVSADEPSLGTYSVVASCFGGGQFLRLSPGEKIDVVRDESEGKVLGRNKVGRYGYVYKSILRFYRASELLSTNSSDNFDDQ